MRTTTVVLLILLTTATCSIFLLPRILPPSMPTPVIVHSQGPTIERLEKLSQLVAIRVHVADVLIGEGNGCKGSWLIRGDALIAVNLGQATIAEKDESSRRATIRLPQPEILQARVDHERTKTWEVKTTTWIPWSSDQDSLRDTVMAEAQRLVGHAAGSKENLQQAKAAAESAIRGFYAEVGWNVAVTWAPPHGQDTDFSVPTAVTCKPLSNVTAQPDAQSAVHSHHEFVKVGLVAPLMFEVPYLKHRLCGYVLLSIWGKERF